MWNIEITMVNKFCSWSCKLVRIFNLKSNFNLFTLTCIISGENLHKSSYSCNQGLIGYKCSIKLIIIVMDCDFKRVKLLFANFNNVPSFNID